MVGIVNIDRQALASGAGDAAWTEEHGLVGGGLEELGIEVVDALVEVVEGAEGGGLVEEADDGGHGEGEEAEEDVHETVVGLGEDHAIAVLVDEQG